LAAIATASPASRLSDDVALIRGLALLPIGVEGLVSTGLGCLFDFLPFGSRQLRLAWVAAFGLGVFSWTLYRVALACQLATLDAPPAPNAARASARGSLRLESALALSAALAAALGPRFLVEGSTPGGFSIAAALALAAVAVGTRGIDFGARTPVVLGAVLGATLLESRWAALGAVLALGLHAVLRREPTSARATLGFSATFVILAALPPVLLALSWLGPAREFEYAVALWQADASRFLPVDRSAALTAWSAVMGLFWCGLSVAGVGFGLVDPRARRLMLPLAAFVLLDASVGSVDLDPSRHDPHGAVRLLGIAALAAGGALAVRVALRWLERARIPFARAASTLIVVYGCALVFVSIEESARANLARELGAADAVSDEILSSLPPAAVLLGRSEPVVLRLLAARYSRGSRPDVLVVSMPLFESSSRAAELLAREDGLLPLVRDLLLSGEPSEFALSALADARPLYVEPDVHWDPRLFGHLVPRPFFSEFAAHPLGRSDRRLGLEQAANPLSRVTAALRDTQDGDPGTRVVLVNQLAHRALVFSALGEREAARDAVRELLRLDPEAPIGQRLQARLNERRQGPLDVAELFAAR
jgi:hypothetical protein